MPFDPDQWRAALRQHLASFARDPQRALADAGVNTLYGFLLGSTVLPLAAAAAHDQAAVIGAVITVAGGLGANLISNLVQKRYDGPDAIQLAAAEAQSSALAPAYEQIATKLQVLPDAAQALEAAGQTAVLAQLRDELARLGKTSQITVIQSGGINLGNHNVIGSIRDIIGGDKVMGDKVTGDKHVTYGTAPKPHQSDEA
ncbi:MAG: hypothetical protein OHK0022_55460 [Roseiflexaceae bacterium]